MKINKRPGEYIYSYGYKEDEAWFTDAQRDGSVQTESFQPERLKAFLERKDVRAEIKKTASAIETAISASISDSSGMDSIVVFPVLTDTHYVLNGNWEYTAATIEAVMGELNGQKEPAGRTKEAEPAHMGKETEPVSGDGGEFPMAEPGEISGVGVKKYYPDGYIHLGDLSDGMLSREICREYSHRVLDRMISWKRPVYLAVGNHDANYFHKNPELMEEPAQYEMYLKELLRMAGGYGIEITSDPSWLVYRADLPGKQLTILVLSSYDNSQSHRYGYSPEQISWVKEQLESLPAENRILFLSHDAPQAQLDYWAKEIRNGNALCDLLDEWNDANHGRILGMLHGHTHADFICRERSFPILSVCCSKIEYFEDKKPEGAIAPVRIEDEVTQEAWDTLILNTKTGSMDLIRFGAGQDRHVEKRAGKGTKAALSTLAPVPGIWAHRGASGYAPENTLEAFALAEKLGAEGIELDVHFTKDRQLVVIHDERIDRTSNGSGLVAEMTLKELRQFNYNKTRPEIPHCEIPTLYQVLELVKPTEMILNIELKTNVNFYPGLEREVMDLVREFAMEERVIYSSFNHESLTRIRRLDASARCGILYNIGMADAAGYAAYHGMNAVHPGVDGLRYPGFTERCRERGMEIHVWTVNTSAQMMQMQQYGVNAIITNYPDLARRLYHGEDRSKELEIFHAAYQQKQVKVPEPAEKSEITSRTKHPNPLLHLAGVLYGKLRKPFVAMDRAINRAAGK